MTEQTTFTNLDGITATVQEHQRNYWHDLKARSISIEPLRGKLGYSELGMHTRTAEKIGIVALVMSYSHAHVLLNDGSIIDGCYHHFPDGSFSLS